MAQFELVADEIGYPNSILNEAEFRFALMPSTKAWTHQFLPVMGK